MITGEFVSCYSCAGEQSDPSVGQLGRGGCAGALMIQAEPEPELEAQVYIL